MTDPGAVVLLLRGLDGSSVEWPRALEPVVRACLDHGAVHVYVGGAVGRNPVLGDRYGVGTSDFDVVVEARFTGDDGHGQETSDLAERLAGALVDLPIDGARSVVAAGTQHVVEQEADVALHVHYALHRPAAIDTAEFRRAWTEDFAPIVRLTPTQRGYRQVHVDHDASQALGARVGFTGEIPDGIACGYFDDGAALVESSTWAQAHPDHRATLESFVELPRSRSILSTPLSETAP